MAENAAQTNWGPNGGFLSRVPIRNRGVVVDSAIEDTSFSQGLTHLAPDNHGGLLFLHKLPKSTSMEKTSCTLMLAHYVAHSRSAK